MPKFNSTSYLQTFVKEVVPIYMLPPTRYKVSAVLHIHQRLLFTCLLNFIQPLGYVLILHCGFNLHFLND